MFQTGAAGRVTVKHASDTLATKRVTSPLVDISAGTCEGVATYPLLGVPAAVAGLPAPSVGILRINLLYQATASAAAGSLDFGIGSDTDGVADDLPTSTTAVAGDIDTFRIADFASALKINTFKAHGHPVITAGNVLLMTITAGAGNAGDFRVEVEYFDIEPSV